MIAKIPFGKTGHDSTRLLFGAAALKACSQQDADGVLELLLKHGINHIDTAAGYGDSELRIAPWLKAHRKDFFLATKTRERSYAGAKAGIRQSLERLGVAQVDLIQLHCLVDEQEWAQAMGPDGALKAAVEARDAGLVRFIGVTGHGLAAPRMHLRSLGEFPFDSVLAPLNYTMLQDAQYRADLEALLAACAQKGVAVQTIKSIARGQWGAKAANRDTWYEPLEDQAAIDRAVAYVLGRPGIFLNTAGDIRLLPRVLEAAERVLAARTVVTDAQMAEDQAQLGITKLFTEAVGGPARPAAR